MKKIVLLSCTKKKKNYSCTAREMYSSSEIFTTAFKYAKLISNDIYILSSKYGLLSCDDIVEPYDECINDITLAERKEWARGIIDNLTQCSNLQEDSFEIITGKAYYEDLIDSLAHYSIPLKGKGISQWIPSLNILIIRRMV